MNYELIPTEFFLNQLDDVSAQAKNIIEERLKLVKINPFRNKKVEGYNLFLFRIRFEDSKKEKRLVYLVDKPKVYVLCILDRDKDYKDLRKYLKSLGY
jgi:mRNA-degrading endonuclease RelE of RelBE toxin-antitoxin system